MLYIELKVHTPAPFHEILIAELAEMGYESFVEEEKALLAYQPEEGFREDLLIDLQRKYQSQIKFSYEYKRMEAQNWNKVWESAYDPVFVDKVCLIRSDFHRVDEAYDYEIIINPKMSFGTGHHETTELMIRQQLELGHTHQRVLDVGCGTGVLAIFAEKRGATFIRAIDIDEWAVNNTSENILVNGCKYIEVSQGTISLLDGSPPFDLILANITRNVLIEEMGAYASLLRENGYLVSSGFHKQDEEALIQAAQSYGLINVLHKEKNNWSSIVFKFEKPK